TQFVFLGSNQFDGAGGTGVVTVDGAGSLLTSNISLVVGHRGNGTLNITNGGMVSSKGGTIAGQSNGNGHVTVQGAGSSWTMTGPSSPLYVGFEGSGTLTISGGGTVTSGIQDSALHTVICTQGAAANGTVIVVVVGSHWTDVCRV